MGIFKSPTNKTILIILIRVNKNNTWQNNKEVKCCKLNKGTTTLQVDPKNVQFLAGYPNFRKWAVDVTPREELAQVIGSNPSKNTSHQF